MLISQLSNALSPILSALGDKDMLPSKKITMLFKKITDEDSTVLDNFSKAHINKIRGAISELVYAFILDDTINTGLNTEDTSIFSKKIDRLFGGLHYTFCDTYIDEKFRYCKEFKEYLEIIVSTFLESFHPNFALDEVRIVVRGYDDRMRDYNFNGSEHTVQDAYWPIVERKRAMSTSTTTRPYRWFSISNKALITARAFNNGNPSPRIYTLNQDLVDFDVANWTDFMVITPKNFSVDHYNNRTGQLELRPIISFGLSLKLLNINTNNGIEDVSRTTKREFKKLSNKLYLLEHIGIQQTLDKMIGDFLEVYKLAPEVFLAYLKETLFS